MVPIPGFFCDIIESMKVFIFIALFLKINLPPLDDLCHWRKNRGYQKSHGAGYRSGLLGYMIVHSRYSHHSMPSTTQNSGFSNSDISDVVRRAEDKRGVY